jgi:hypothetical protein
MLRVFAILVSLVAATAVADDSNQAALSSSPSPVDSKKLPATQPDLHSRSHLETTPELGRDLDRATLLEWYRDRFLWDPARPDLSGEEGTEGCLAQLTEKKWVQRPKGGAYRYLRKKALHYFKKHYRRQLRENLERDPSYSFDDFEAGHQAWHRASLIQSVNDRPLQFGEVVGEEGPNEAAPDPYIARVGPFRIDDVYRLEVDLHDLWSAEAPEYDPVPGLGAPARTLRKAPRRRLLNLKMSTRLGVRVGNGLEAQDILRNYGAKFKAEYLPGRKKGPLFASEIGVKMTLDGRARITLNLIEKRF